MKKILAILLLPLFFLNNIQAAIIEKKYNVLEKKIINAPPIIEFFSFLCPHCYELEKIYNLNHYIKKHISHSVKIERYHVNFLGGKFGQALTQIWEISKMIGLDNKILIPLFKKIQDEKTITNFHTLKNEFLKLTLINEKELKFLWNCFVIKSIIYNQNIIQNTINLDHIPSILINGKYSIDNEKINYNSKKEFIKDYIHVIKFLLKKK
ncbi:MAG: thioredoxin domain-containing protein [Buchnera aphidicola (Nurudea yanoniella)]